MQEFLADTVDPIQIEPGGSLVVVSDGIFEAFDPGGEQFGVNRVVELLMNDADGEISSIAQQIRDRVEDWQKRADPADDQTVVIAARK